MVATNAIWVRIMTVKRIMVIHTNIILILESAVKQLPMACQWAQRVSRRPTLQKSSAELNVSELGRFPPKDTMEIQLVPAWRFSRGPTKSMRSRRLSMFFHVVERGLQFDLSTPEKS